MKTHELLLPSVDRARELTRLIQEVEQHSEKGLELDDQGRVRRIVKIDDSQPQRVLGDFDTHY